MESEVISIELQTVAYCLLLAGVVLGYYGRMAAEDFRESLRKKPQDSGFEPENKTQSMVDRILADAARREKLNPNQKKRGLN